MFRTIETPTAEVQALPETIFKNGFLYTLVKRNEYKALYAQGTVAHELFLIKVRTKKDPETGERIVFEAFPGNNEFGSMGGAWSISPNREKALKRYEDLRPPKRKSRKIGRRAAA